MSLRQVMLGPVLSRHLLSSRTCSSPPPDRIHHPNKPTDVWGVVTRTRLARSHTWWVFCVSLVSNPWSAPQEAPASALRRCTRCWLAEDSHSGRDRLTLAATLLAICERRENTSCPRLLEPGWKSKEAAKVDNSSDRTTQGRKNLILPLALKKMYINSKVKFGKEILPPQKKEQSVCLEIIRSLTAPTRMTSTQQSSWQRLFRAVITRRLHWSFYPVALQQC